METRITKLENLAEKTGERLMRIETRLDTFATKEDLYRAEGSIRTDMHREFTIQTWRIIGAMITFGGLLVATTFFIARNVH